MERRGASEQDCWRAVKALSRQGVRPFSGDVLRSVLTLQGVIIQIVTILLAKSGSDCVVYTARSHKVT